MQALQAVKHSNAENVHINYDSVADVMYVSFGEAIAADDSEMGDDDILYRYKDGEIIGMTVTSFSTR